LCSLLVSASLPKLCACVRALLSLLYPMEWKHTVVSACPAILADLVCSPTPYIIGVPAGCFACIPADLVASVVIAHLDEKRLQTPGKLPSLAAGHLVCEELRRIAKMSQHSEEESSALIARQVTNVHSAFWFGWQNHIVQLRPGSALQFDAAEFARSRPAGAQPLAEHFCASTMFFDMVTRLEQQDAHVTTFLSLSDSAAAAHYLSASGGSPAAGSVRMSGRLLGMFGRRRSTESLLDSETSSVVSSAVALDERSCADDAPVLAGATAQADLSADAVLHTPQPQPAAAAAAADGARGDTPSSAGHNSDPRRPMLLPALNRRLSLPALTDPSLTDDEAYISAVETPLASRSNMDSGSSGSISTRKYGPRVEGSPDCTPQPSPVATVPIRDFGSEPDPRQNAGGQESVVAPLAAAPAASITMPAPELQAPASAPDQWPALCAQLYTTADSIILSTNKAPQEGYPVLYVGTDQYTLVPGTTLGDLRNLYAPIHLLLLGFCVWLMRAVLA
jgi:hypothetical protein